MGRRNNIIAYLDKVIGPRVVGGVYHNANIGITYRVTAVERDEQTGVWSVTELDLDGPHPGRVRNHCTAWDARRASIITLPQEVAA